MSPNINSFVGDLVAMAQAVEELPKVQAELDKIRSEYGNKLQVIQDRELSIIHYKQQIEDLISKVRSLEVERDDASFRVLEAEDNASMVLSKAQVARATLDVIIAKLDSPKPQPEPEVSQPAAVELSQGSSEANPQSLGETSSTEPHGGNVSQSPVSENPTPPISPSGDQPISTPKPYEGKYYHDMPHYISYHDWIEGGGGDNAYYRGRQAPNW